MVLKIGLTGGIGSGKSTACNIFASLGVPVIDADVIAEKLVQPGTVALKSIIQHFGEQIVDKNGCLNRAELRNEIFANATQRKKLEEIVHPAIYKEIIHKVENINSRYCIISIPLLIEINILEIVDRVLVTDVSKELQLLRAAARDNVEKQEIDMIIQTQVSRGTRKAIADDIISNMGDMAYLHKQILQLHEFYMGY